MTKTSTALLSCLLCLLPACDPDAATGDGDAALDDVVGFWRQVGCSDAQGEAIDCLVPLDEARRDLEIRDDGEVVHWWTINGTPAPPSVDGSHFEAGEICVGVVGCYPVYFDGDQLLFCLNDSACETFEFDG